MGSTGGKVSSERSRHSGGQRLDVSAYRTASYERTALVEKVGPATKQGRAPDGRGYRGVPPIVGSS